MYLISSERIIGSYAVKYKTLIPMINTEYNRCKSDTMNIFIDLSDILKSISAQPINSPNPYSITSSIINLCAHYRNFFREYYHSNTRIFIIASIMDNSCLNNKYLPDYHRNVFGPTNKINDIISKSLSMLELIVPYIDDIHFCTTNYEFGVYVTDIITNDFNVKGVIYPGIIITKDKYNYQLVSDDGTMMTVLRPKKRVNEDVSTMITHSNAIYSYCYERKVECQLTNINSSLLSFIFAMTRMPERGIRSMHQIPSVIKALDQTISSGTIMNGYTTDTYYLCEQISNVTNLKIKDPFMVAQRFKAVDIQTQFATYSAESFNKFDGIMNLYDPKAIKEISMQYFKEYPLDLNVL